MSKNSLFTTPRSCAISGELTRTDKAISYMGWYAPELVAIFVIAVAAGIFTGWLLLAALAPLGYAAVDGLSRFRANRLDRRRRELRAAKREVAESQSRIADFTAALEGGNR